jgi:hypothetical protein
MITITETYHYLHKPDLTNIKVNSSEPIILLLQCTEICAKLGHGSSLNIVSFHCQQDGGTGTAAVTVPTTKQSNWQSK